MYMGREVYVHSNSFGADQPPAQQKQLHGYKRLNRTEECLACFDEMLFYGVKPSTRTYDGTTFRGVGALTDPCSHVNSTYPPPTHTHPPISPGVLGALAAAERWGQFRMYLERMEKDGVKLSAITYGWAMRGAERAQVRPAVSAWPAFASHPTKPPSHAHARTPPGLGRRPLPLPKPAGGPVPPHRAHVPRRAQGGAGPERRGDGGGGDEDVGPGRLELWPVRACVVFPPCLSFLPSFPLVDVGWRVFLPSFLPLLDVGCVFWSAFFPFTLHVVVIDGMG